MQSKIELHLEKVWREYLSTKNYIIEFKKTFPELKKEIGEKALECKTDEERNDLYFEKVGWSSALEADFVQLKGRLYHTYEAYKDLIEIPQEIKKEVEDITFKLTYNVKGTELELVDKEIYEFYKTQFLETQKYLKTQMGGK